MTRKTKAEPKFFYTVSGTKLTGRGPLVGPCSKLHQYLRELTPELSGQGIFLD